MRLKAEFKLAIQALTPLHIGTGRVLEEDFDYVIRDGRTLRLHEERFVEWINAREEDFRRLTQGVPPGRILGAHIDPALIRYAIAGTPQNTNRIRECLKDAHDRPYLPASSLKGALRTVLLWQVWKEQNFSLAHVKVNKDKPKFAAQELERQVFGESPHQDLLKALCLSDSEPIEPQRLLLANVRCISRAAKNGIPIALEAVSPGTIFIVKGHVDETAFRPWGNWDNFGFLPQEKRSWLGWDRIAQAARERARQRLERDIDWANWVKVNPKPWEELLELVTKSGRQGFPLQIGFGTGWLGTTLGTALLADPGFAEVYQKYRLGVNPRTRRQTPLEHFPASRRLVRSNNVDRPLGWIWVIPKEEP